MLSSRTSQPITLACHSQLPESSTSTSHLHHLHLHLPPPSSQPPPLSHPEPQNPLTVPNSPPNPLAALMALLIIVRRRGLAAVARIHRRDHHEAVNVGDPARLVDLGSARYKAWQVWRCWRCLAVSGDMTQWNAAQLAGRAIDQSTRVHYSSASAKDDGARERLTVNAPS